MSRRHLYFILFALCGNPCRAEAASPPIKVAFTSEELAQILKLSPLPPVPADPTNRVANDPAAAHLGQFLFFDKRLSEKGLVSCARCHDPTKNWSDGQSTPAQFSPSLRHVPSLWNVAYNRWYFWDGRADSLWTQALEPLENPLEHRGNRLQFVGLLFSDDQLHKAYENVFGPLPPALKDVSGPAAATNPSSSEAFHAPGRPRPPPWEAHRDEINRVFANLGKALAAYERRIVSRHAPFDIFVEGLKTNDSTKLDVLSLAAQHGLKLFIGRANCITCHHGPNFTDGEFHNTGVEMIAPRLTPDVGRFDGINALLKNPFSSIGANTDDPDGRVKRPTWYLNNAPQCKGQFKTPSLRNVAVTAPYMHRGQLATLESVLKFYSTLRIPALQDPYGRPPENNSQDQSAGHTHTSGVSEEHILVPLNLSKSESDVLIAFLNSLTDVKIDPALTTQPASPIYR
jgi:cytochrome c peroxidase